MKKAAISLFAIGIGLLSNGCIDKSHQEIAKKKADLLISSLANDNAISFFPKKYFRADDIKGFLERIRTAECDYANRDVTYAGSNVEVKIGSEKMAFTYRCVLKCDAFKFVLFYTFEKEPVLMGFKIVAAGPKKSV